MPSAGDSVLDVRTRCSAAGTRVATDTVSLGNRPASTGAYRRTPLSQENLWAYPDLVDG